MKMHKTLVLSLILAAGSTATFSVTAGCAATGTKRSTGQYVDDSAITAKVKAEFVRDPIVKALSVDVTTYKGVVQLSGYVDTAAQKDQAGKVARAVEGVQDVKNSISVKGS